MKNWNLRLHQLACIFMFLSVAVSFYRASQWSATMAFLTSPLAVMLLELSWIVVTRRSMAESSFVRLFRYTSSREMDLAIWFYWQGGLAPIWLLSFPEPNLSHWLAQWQLPILSWLNIWAIIAISIVLNSLLEFFTHWMAHRVPELWELHKIHHSATEMTVLTVQRDHLLLILVINSFRIAVFTLVGLPLQMMIAFSIFRTLQTGLLHSRCDSSWGYVGRILMSPRSHWIHHSENPAHYNHNFASDFTLWDRIFGTYLPDCKTEIRIGIAQETEMNVAQAMIFSLVGAGRVFKKRFTKRPPDAPETPMKASA